MRSKFDEQLSLLNRELISMGALCEEAIADATKALLTSDPEFVAKVRPLEKEIDHKEREIESICLRLLLQQQPVAGDLRQISAALKMTTDMERIGDQASDIAEITGFIGGVAERDGGLISEMARAVVKMVTESVDSFVKQDVALARAVMRHDDVVDGLFTRIKTSLIELLAARPEEGGYALDILMIAKYLERIGDHATNIAEWVEFSVTGSYKGDEVL
jgi:phosphate transport system protein